MFARPSATCPARRAHWSTCSTAARRSRASAPARSSEASRAPPDARPERRDARPHGLDRAPRARLVPRARDQGRAGLGARDPGGAVGRRACTRSSTGPALSELLRPRRRRSRISRVLVGGYFGSWLAGRRRARLAPPSSVRRRCGRRTRAGVIVALGPDACARRRDSRGRRLLRCRVGGPVRPVRPRARRDRRTVQAVATGTAEPRRDARLARWSSELRRRGACAHPDGAVRFVASALRVFSDEFHDHALRGRASGASTPPSCPRRLRPSEMNVRLRVNPIRCKAHGICAELAARDIALDEWGYPMHQRQPVDPRAADLARRAADACPTLALLLDR